MTAFYSTCRLTFIKSYNKGHAMVNIHSGLMSGDELVNEFSTAHSATKIFFVLDPCPRKYVECY